MVLSSGSGHLKCIYQMTIEITFILQASIRQSIIKEAMILLPKMTLNWKKDKKDYFQSMHLVINDWNL